MDLYVGPLEIAIIAALNQAAYLSIIPRQTASNWARRAILLTAHLCSTYVSGNAFVVRIRGGMCLRRQCMDVIQWNL